MVINRKEKIVLGIKKIGSKAIKVLRARNDNNGEISFIDVKELYDAAYAEKDKARVNLKRFKALLVKATNLDTAYREQLMQTKSSLQYGRAA